MLVCFQNAQLLGSGVNNTSKILIKASNAKEYIELNIQNIMAPRIDDPIILYV